MLPHLGTDRSEQSGRGWIKRATPVLAAVLLIAASGALISHSALAAPVDAHDADDSAIVAHHSPDGAIGFDFVVRHTCRHADACNQAVAFHACRHADASHHACTAALHPAHHGDRARQLSPAA